MDIEGSQESTTNLNQNAYFNINQLKTLSKQIFKQDAMDSNVEELITVMGENLIEDVLSSALDLAIHRDSKSLEASDITFIMKHKWKITMGSQSQDEVADLKKSNKNPIHQQKMNIINNARQPDN